jgi:hypothetical protein
MGKNASGIVPVPPIARLARAEAALRIVALGAQKRRHAGAGKHYGSWTPRRSR